MARPQKYDWAKIEIDYRAGLSQKEFKDIDKVLGGSI